MKKLKNYNTTQQLNGGIEIVDIKLLEDEFFKAIELINHKEFENEYKNYKDSAKEYFILIKKYNLTELLMRYLSEEDLLDSFTFAHNEKILQNNELRIKALEYIKSKEQYLEEIIKHTKKTSSTLDEISSKMQKL